MCSPLNLAKFLRTSSFWKTSGELLLLGMESINNLLWKETRTVCIFPGSTTVGLEVHCPTRNIRWKYFQARLKSFKKNFFDVSGKFARIFLMFFSGLCQSSKGQLFQMTFWLSISKKNFRSSPTKKMRRKFWTTWNNFFTHIILLSN